MKNLVLLFVFTLVTSFAFSQDPYGATIIVEGKSSVKMAPELITFNINFSVSDTNYTHCANLALEKIEKIKAQFTTNGIDKELIKTVNYSIREEREHDRNLGRQVFKGYRADIPILLKTKVNNPQNDQIFEIIKNNFQADFRLNFVLSPDQIVTIKEELITLAVEDAKSKAQLLAKSAGVKLGKITKIQYGEPQTIRNMTNARYDLLHPSQLESGLSKSLSNSFTPIDIEMRTSVMLAWEIEY
jgi:uncharacterized protein YggE